MHYWVWCTTSACLAAIGETVLGQYGFSLPLLLATSFYFAVIGPWEKSTPLLLFPAFLTDSLSPVGLPVASMNLLVAILLAGGILPGFCPSA